MNDIHILYDIYEALMSELEKSNEKIKMAGGEVNGSDIEYLNRLTHALKSVKTVIAMEESDYSHDMMDDSMRGSSYARGRGSNARRDSMGRYTSRGYSRGRYSRDEGKMEVKEQLEDIMMSAPDEETKRMIKMWMKELDR